MGFLITFTVLASLGLIWVLVSLSLRVSRALRLAGMANNRLTESMGEYNRRGDCWMNSMLEEIRRCDARGDGLQSRISRLETVRREFEKEKLDYKCMLRELSETSERCKQLTGSLYNVKETVGELSKVVGKLQESETVSADLLAGIKADADEMLKTAYNVKETVGELSKVVGKLQESETVSADLLAGIKADADEMLKTAVEYSDQDRDMSRSLAECQKQLAEHHRSIVRVSDDVHAVKKLVKLEGQQKQVQSLVNQSLQGVVVGGMDSKPGARNRGAKPSSGKTSAK